MTNNIIKGIDEVIKGLTTIKGALMAIDHAPIKEAVKEAVEEAIERVVPPIVEEAPVEVKKVEKKAKVVESEVEEEIEDTVEEAVGFDREAKRAELEAMKYNDLKALAGTLEGASAVGKKADIIESILNAYEAMGGVPSEEETTEGEEQEIQDEAKESEDVADEQEGEEVDDDEYREEFVEFLESLETDELIEIAEQAGIKVDKKVVKANLIEELVEDLDKLVEALEALGYYDEEDEEDTVEASEEVIEQEEEEEDEEEGEDETVEVTEEETEDEEDERVKIIEEYGLEEYTVEELADICAKFDLSTKGKKQALIDRIVKGIMDGTIELEDEPEEQEEEAQEEEKAPLKKVAEYDNPQRAKKEAEVEADIRDKYEKGKLKDSAIKKFLDKYNEGDPDCAGCKGCSKEDMLECYIDIHKALVDDDGDLNEFEEPYIRDGEYYCCGKEIKELENGNLYCQVCGTEYEG